MNDKLVFFDSNILVYLIDDDEVKKEKANMLLHPDYLISSQVVGENVNACLKSLKLSKEVAFDHGDFIMSKLKLVPILPPTLKLAFLISNKYQLSWWDSLIVASALENNCEILYSEDMQDGMVIESKLTIINPFKIK